MRQSLVYRFWMGWGTFLHVGHDGHVDTQASRPLDQIVQLPEHIFTLEKLTVVYISKDHISSLLPH
jgi:hypothetical protein